MGSYLFGGYYTVNGMRAVLMILLLSAFVPGFTQQKAITGTVLNFATKQPLANATVVVVNNAETIIAFALTNVKGEFEILPPQNSRFDSLWLRANFTGYQEQKIKLEITKNKYVFSLTELPKSLDSVVVKAVIPIKVSNDTLSYSVQAFARAEDRTVADIMKRLPGITVADNGQISYNGKAIANLYIQGDDLMDGRYGMATKVVKKELINRIEVIQNFQPINVLRDKIFSADVAINLTLANPNDWRLNGDATLGAGIPSLYTAAINTMVLNSRFKFLNSGMMNNAGINYRDDFRQYNSDEMLTAVDAKKPPKFVSLASPALPDVPEQYYYNNRSTTVNLNALFNTKDSLQIRTNIQWLGDRNKLDFNNTVLNFTNTDTVVFNQLQNVINKENLLNVSVNFLKNKYNSYWQNKTSAVIGTETNNSAITFNANTFTQQLQARVRGITNEFVFIPKLKKNMLTIKWYATLGNTPEQLLVNTTIDSVVLNNGSPFKQAKQNTALPSLFTNLSASYIVVNKRLIKQQYETGVVIDRQQFNSVLNITQLSGSENVFTGDAGNSLQWLRQRYFVKAAYSLQRNRLRANLVIPVSLQRINYTDAGFNLAEQQQQVFINPKLDVQLPTGKENFIELTFQHQNLFGGAQQLFRGLVVANYRTIQSNISSLQELYNTGSGLQYNFRRALQMFFASAGVRFTTQGSNTIEALVLSNNLLQNTLLPFNNRANTWLGNVEVSKYFFSLKTKVSGRVFYQRTQNNQLVNNASLQFLNSSFATGVDVDTKLASNLHAMLAGSFAWAGSRAAAPLPNGEMFPATNFIRYDAKLALNYNIKSTFFQAGASYSASFQQQSNPIELLFADASIRKRIKKMDYVLEAQNLFNVQKFENFIVTGNTFATNSFALRGRLLLLKAVFNF